MTPNSSASQSPKASPETRKHAFPQSSPHNNRKSSAKPGRSPSVSSNLSTLSTASRPPRWRTASITQKSSAGVSLVVAEADKMVPKSGTSSLKRLNSTISTIKGQFKGKGKATEEQGSKLPSETTEQDSQQVPTESYDPPQSIEEPTSSSAAGQPVDEGNVTIQPSPAAVSVPEPPDLTPRASDVSQIEFPRTDSPLSSEPSSPPKSSPMPIAQPEMKSSHTEQAEAAKSASPSSTSWFSSFGRAKGKKLAPVPALEDTTRSEPSPILEESEPPSAVNLFHPQTGPLAVPSIDNAPFVGANQLAPLQEYHALQRTQTALSIPSSLDTVTRVESTESSPIPTSPIAEGHRGLMRTPSSDATLRTRMDSLNPSTGRFNLGILFPFGGSNNSVSKVDADRRDAVGPIEATNSGSTGTDSAVTEEDASTTIDEVDNSDDRTTINVAPVEDPPQSEQPEPKSTTDEAQLMVRHEEKDGLGNTSTWWTYIGWGANTTASVESKPMEESDREPAGTAEEGQITETVEPSQEGENPQDTAAEPAIEGLPNDHTEPASAIKGLNQGRPASTSALSSNASSWIPSWTWYPSSSVPNVAVQEGEKTASERVKEEYEAKAETPIDAVQTDELVITDRQPEQSESQATDSLLNSSTKSSWAYFFSSNTTLQKRIEAPQVERDENGIEIMEVPDVEPAAPADPPKEKKDPEPKPEKASGKKAPPTLVISEEVKSKANARSRTPSAGSSKLPAPSKSASASDKGTPPPTPQKQKKPTKKVTAPVPAKPKVPNLILPTWDDTFRKPPRSQPVTKKTQESWNKWVPGVFKGKGKEREKDNPADWLPKEIQTPKGPLKTAGLKVAIIGIHGWFPGAIMRSVLGEPTGTSGKFVTMMVQALKDYQAQEGGEWESITEIPLEGEGMVSKRVENLYKAFTGNQEWVDAVRNADAVFVATHSQGSVVSTHLMSRLLEEGILCSNTNASASTRNTTMPPVGFDGGVNVPGSLRWKEPQPRRVQKICMLALCGIHLGPLRYLSASSFVQPYIQYFENEAAKELFEFQNTESEVSKQYVAALSKVVSAGIKIVYVASLNDQVVPLYSGLFTAAQHPSILRALYIDGDAYHSSDFLSNLLVLLLRVRNAGLSDSGLLEYLSEATAGSLSGVGHSTAYEELGVYSLAVRYLFQTTDTTREDDHLVIAKFDALGEVNDYEIPWALRDILADHRVTQLFAEELLQLRDAFRDWHPRTTILRDIKRKLAPIQRWRGIIHDIEEEEEKEGRSRL